MINLYNILYILILYILNFHLQSLNFNADFYIVPNYKKIKINSYIFIKTLTMSFDIEVEFCLLIFLHILICSTRIYILKIDCAFKIQYSGELTKNNIVAISKFFKKIIHLIIIIN